MTLLTRKTTIPVGCACDPQIPDAEVLGVKAAIFAVFLCMFFGSNVVAVKIALGGFGSFTIAGLRFGMTALIIFAWARMTGRPIAVQRKHMPGLLIVCALFAVHIALFYMGIDKTDASRAALLVNLQPFIVLILAHYFLAGDRITIRKFAGILIGFLGIGFVFMENSAVEADWRLGDLIILATTVLWAINAVYTKILLTRFEPFQIVMYSTMFSAPFFFLGALIWDRPMIGDLDSNILGAIIYQGLLTPFGFVAWCAMFKKYGAVAVNSFVFVIPVSAVALSGLILGEPITPKIIAALVFIAVGIIVIHFQSEKSDVVLEKDEKAVAVGKNNS